MKMLKALPNYSILLKTARTKVRLPQPYFPDKFYLEAVKTNHTNDRLWLVIRSLKERGYIIKKNDIIKLGRMKFKVKEFRTETEFFDAEEDLSSEFSEVEEVQKGPEEEKD